MKVGRIGLNKVDDYFLVGLLQRPNCMSNVEEIQREFFRRLENESEEQVLVRWKKTQNSIIKELLEEYLATRYLSGVSITNLSKLSYEYFHNVKSLNAIVSLTYASCPEIRKLATEKYMSAMMEYLEESEWEDWEYYEREGNDSEISDNNKILKFEEKHGKLNQREIRENAKIYKISDLKRRKNND